MFAYFCLFLPNVAYFAYRQKALRAEGLPAIAGDTSDNISTGGDAMRRGEVRDLGLSRNLRVILGVLVITRPFFNYPESRFYLGPHPLSLS